MHVHRLSKGNQRLQVWDFNSKRSIVSKDIVFKEDEMFKAAEEVREQTQGELQLSSQVEILPTTYENTNKENSLRHTKT